MPVSPALHPEHLIVTPLGQIKRRTYSKGKRSISRVGDIICIGCGSGNIYCSTR